MLGLKVAVVAMGVLIVAGVAVLAVTLVGRMSAYGGGIASGGAGREAVAAGSVLLDEPAGTRIAGVSMAPERLAVRLQGGGPDRVVVVDLRGGRVLGRVGLAQ